MRNIRKSLTAAAAHKPQQWVLAIPLNHTPKEEKWFQTLQEEFATIELKWRGIDWLDPEFEKRPYLRRMLEGESYQLLGLAKQYDRERDVLAGGLRDYASRLTALTALGDDLFAHWIADPARTPEGLVFSFRERYPGAAEDHPFAYEPTFTFPPDDPEAQHFEKQWLQVKNYGGKAVVPGRFVESLNINASEEEQRALGFDRPEETYELEIQTRSTAQGLPLACTLEVKDQAGNRVAAVPFQFTSQVSGARGATLSGPDSSGVLGIELIYDAVDGSGNFAFNFSSPFGRLPYDLRPIAELVIALVEGNEIHLKRGHSIFGKAAVAETFSPYDERLARLIIALDDVQKHFEQQWSLPEGLTGNDLSELETLVKLVQDGYVEWPYKSLRMTFRADALEDVVQSDFFNATGAIVGRFGSFGMEFAGHRVELGSVQFFGGQMELTNRDEVRAAVGSGVDTVGKWKCIDGTAIHVQTITPHELESENPIQPKRIGAKGKVYVGPTGTSAI